MALSAVHPGILKHQVTIERRVETRDEFGAVVITWQVVATVWAALWPARGREFYAARQVIPEAVGRCIIRYRADVTSAMRLRLWDGRIYDIIAVITPDEEPRYQELYYRHLVGSEVTAT